MSLLTYAEDPDYGSEPDPGLQVERTSLAWTRTILATVACSLTMLRWSHRFPAIIFALVLVLALCAATIAARQKLRYRRHSKQFDLNSIVPNTIGALALAAAVAICSAVEFVAIISV